MEKNFLPQQWHRSLLFLKAEKKYFITPAILFFSGILISAIILLLHPNLIAHTTDYIYQIFGEAMKEIETNHDTFFFILKNNMQAMALMIIWGVIPFLFIPSLSALVNGAMISFVWFMSMEQGVAPIAFFALIVPHGILEIPALFISCGVGFYLCMSMTRKIIGEKSIKPALFNCLRVFLCIILPLTVLAAVIEAYITPIIGGFFI